MNEFETKMLENAELNRREHPSVETSNLSNAVLEELESATGVSITDYSEYGNVIDRAIHHLDESLPNGQLKRSSYAVLALEYSVRKLKLWMAARGYLVDEASLDLVENLERPIPPDVKIRLDPKTFKGKDGKLLEAQEFTATRDEENSREQRSDRRGFSVTTAYKTSSTTMRIGKTFYYVENGNLLVDEFRVVEVPTESAQ